MRKSIFGLFVLLIFAGTVSAQDALSAYKDAKKAHVKYTTSTDQSIASVDLESARAAIDIASAGVDIIPAKEHFKLWDLKGKVYNEIATLDINKKEVAQRMANGAAL